MGKLNEQTGNVGNLGDILKHSALVSLLDVVSQHARRILWVDTHAFLLEAPCANISWRRDVSALSAEHPEYQRYVDLQPGMLAGARYRCSTGIVVDALRRAGHPQPTLVLGEHDALTRRHLNDQLRREGLTPRELLEDARQLRDIEPPRDVDALMALVDPFGLDEALWCELREGLGKAYSSAKPGVVLVFTHEFIKHARWFDGPVGLEGPVATIDRKPHHLAVYATPGIAESVRNRCASLGWRRTEAGAADD